MKRKHRHVAIAAAAALIAGTAANAQQSQAQPREPQRSVWEDSLAYDDYLAGQALRASELIGAPVHNEAGEELGEVKDLIVSRQDDVIEAVIAVGGILGIGEKDVGVSYDRLRVSADGETLYLGMTREQLEAEPAFEMPERNQVAARTAPPVGVQQQTAEQRQLTQQEREATQPQAATRQPAQPQASERAEQQAAQQQAQQQQAAQQRQQAEQQRQQAEQAAQERQQAQQQAAQQRQQAEQQQQQAQQAAQERRQQAQQQAAQRQQQAAAQPQAGEQRSTGDVVVMERTDRRATDLIGMTVIDSSGEEVGQIDDLVVSPQDGTIEAVLAIGGVLGIGQRLVALPLEDLELAPRGQPVGGEQAAEEDDKVRIDMTAQELESRPEFQYSDEERTANVR